MRKILLLLGETKQSLRGAISASSRDDLGGACNVRVHFIGRALKNLVVGGSYLHEIFSEKSSAQSTYFFSNCVSDTDGV